MIRPPTVHPVDRFRSLFDGPPALIGNVHLPALPGAPAYDGRSIDEICAFAVEEARTFTDAGFDGIMIENAGDLPYARPEDLGPEVAASLAVVTREVVRNTGVPVGITCVANGVVSALAAAKVSGALFVRANVWVTAYVANEGFLDGEAAASLRYAAAIGASPVLVLADVKVKFGAHAVTADRGIADVAKDAQMYCADAVIVTGSRTGDPASVADVREVSGAVDVPVLVGSGINEDNVGDLLGVADGAIVGASVKEGRRWWNRVDSAQAIALVAAARNNK